MWIAADEAAFYAHAPAHLHLALRLALWTGQRRGNLLRLTWANYDGTHIRMVQRKTVRKKLGRPGTRVVTPVAAPLKAALDALDPDKRPATEHILLTARRTPWTEAGFRA